MGELEDLERLARLLDSSIRLPGGYRIGIDPILGLIPGIGDVAGFAISAYVALRGATLGVSNRTKLVMTLNILLESAVGTIPIIGDVFDAMWKANERNMHLIKKDLGYDSEPPSQKGLIAFLLIAGILLFGLLFLIAWGILALIQWII